MGDHFEVAPLVKTYIENNLRDVPRVDHVPELTGVEKLTQVVPAIYIVWDGEDVLAGARKRAGMNGTKQLGGYSDGLQRIRQFWLFVLVVRNPAKSGTGERLLEEAGKLMGDFVTLLTGWPPSQTKDPFVRVTAPRPRYLPSCALLPVRYQTEFWSK